MRILVTGGTGYIGSHTCVELLEKGYEVVIIDNLYNSSKSVVKKIKEITSKEFNFYEIDLLDKEALNHVFEKEQVNAVIHFAGYKAVGESVEKPLEYYQNNLVGTINLCEIMRKHNVFNLVFSSSATVYGDPHTVPISEDFPLTTKSPYGSTKLMIETILSDIAYADKHWSIVALRYFNPIGAHKSGLIGDIPTGIPNNLTPYIAQVATGKLEYLRVWGNDYETIDGTGVRDYIHVVDLALGHISAIEFANENNGIEFINLGTGKGYSVLEVLHAFEKACGKELEYRIMERREGDIALSYADTKKAQALLHWKAERDIDEMCQDLWNFSSKNPNGI